MNPPAKDRKKGTAARLVEAPPGGKQEETVATRAIEATNYLSKD